MSLENSSLESLPELTEHSIAQMIERHASEAPDAPCLEYLGISMTYGQLSEWSNRFANMLRSLGINRGDAIGLHLPNTPQYIIGLLAASRLGCPASGVSPLLKADELAYQIEDANIRYLFTLDSLFAPVATVLDGKLPGLKAAIITGPIDFLPAWKQTLARLLGKVPKVNLPTLTHVKIVNFWPTVRRASNERVFEPVGLDDVMMIQYTGGTTGRPKGAELTTRNVLSNVEQNVAVVHCELGKETFASAFPYFHIAGLCNLLIGLRHRGRILMVPNPRDVKMFAQLMQKYPPSLLSNVPALYQMLLDEPEFHKIDFSGLKMAFSGAAPAPAELIRRVEKVVGEGKYCEAYGLTETSPVLTLNRLGSARPGTIGHPMPETDIRIVDAETGTREMPVNEPGELIARGPQVFRGYLGLPEETAKALREFEGQTYFYTGDIAAKDEQGYFRICDRAKDMLIVGGYKVFSVEVENKLKEMPEIELSALIGTPDDKRPGNDVVNLFVQLTTAGQAHGEETVRERILEFCREKLAPYKVPKHIHILPQIPLTPVGKIDKKALRVTKD
jgi:long-chain acyl-CoA synthetase